MKYRDTINLLVFYITFLLFICHSNIQKIEERVDTYQINKTGN